MTMWIVILCLTVIPVAAAIPFWIKRFGRYHTETIWDMLLMTFLVVAAMSTLITGAAGIGTFIADKAGCYDTGNQVGLPSRFTSNLSGCYLRFHGQWIPYDRWLYETTGSTQ